MTRAKISVGILLLLVSVSVYSSLWVNRRCGDMLSELSHISALAENGENEKAAVLAEKLSSDWEDFRKKASVLLKYDRLVDVDRLCSRIVHLAENDSEELQSELAELRDMLEMMKSSETPKLTSVL
jgi:hypothetical protein